MTFQEQLKKWRGKRYHKQAADALKVSVCTYRCWEYGTRTPKPITMPEILRRMEWNQE